MQKDTNLHMRKNCILSGAHYSHLLKINFDALINWMEC